jgi:hypothetical protein
MNVQKREAEERVTKCSGDSHGCIKRMKEDKLLLPKQRMESTESKEIRVTGNKTKVAVLKD